MTDLRSIEQKIDKIIASGNTRIQTDTLTSLLTQVREYARSTAEARDLANDVRTLRTQIEKAEAAAKEQRKKSEASSDDVATNAYALEQEVLHMEQTLNKAEQAERVWNTQRQVLKKIHDEVETLRTEIKKIV